MKKLSKRLVAFFACIALAASPLALFGCNNGGNPSFEETGEIMATAAKNFYADHNSAENYADSTYHWLQTETTKETVKFEYKKNATDEQKTESSFENKTVETTDTKIALKKSGDHVIAEVISTKTTVGKEYGVKEDDTLDEINSTVVETKKYRLFVYDEGGETKDVLLFEQTEKIGDADATVVTKKYGTKESSDDYDYFMKNTMIYRTNRQIAQTFFSLSEFMLFYRSLITIEKDGNLVRFSFGYDDLTGVNNDENNEYHVERYSARVNAFYKDGNVWKADSYGKTIGETRSTERTVVFEYSASATVNTTAPVLDDYDGPTNIYSNWSDNDNLQKFMENLPSIELF